MGSMNFINSDFSKTKHCSCVSLKLHTSSLSHSKYEILHSNEECWDILSPTATTWQSSVLIFSKVFIGGQLKWPLLLNHCSPSKGTRQNGRPCAKSCSINSPTSFLIYPCGSLFTTVAQGPCWNDSGGPVAVCLFPKNLIQNCTTFSLGSTSFPSPISKGQALHNLEKNPGCQPKTRDPWRFSRQLG